MTVGKPQTQRYLCLCQWTFFGALWSFMAKDMLHNASRNHAVATTTPLTQVRFIHRAVSFSTQRSILSMSHFLLSPKDWRVAMKVSAAVVLVLISGKWSVLSKTDTSFIILYHIRNMFTSVFCWHCNITKARLAFLESYLLQFLT